jgi:hypothetical protein
MSLDAANLKKDTLPEKRYTLIVALLNRMRVRARDDLADMFVRRMGAIHKRASEELEVIQRRQRTQVEELVVLLDGVVDILVDQSDETTIAQSIRKWLAPKGDLESLRESCAAVRAITCLYCGNISVRIARSSCFSPARLSGIRPVRCERCSMLSRWCWRTKPGTGNGLMPTST